jgi:hypothetical protein
MTWRTAFLVGLPVAAWVFVLVQLALYLRDRRRWREVDALRRHYDRHTVPRTPNEP